MTGKALTADQIARGAWIDEFGFASTTATRRGRRSSSARRRTAPRRPTSSVVVSEPDDDSEHSEHLDHKDNGRGLCDACWGDWPCQYAPESVGGPATL